MQKSVGYGMVCTGMDTPTVRILSQTPLFQGLSAEACRQLAERVATRRLAKRDILFMEQTRGTEMYILAEGRIQLHKATPEGGEVAIRTLQAGDVFAEVVLFEADRYPVTATALAPSQVLALARADILDLLKTPSFLRDFIAALMRKQRYLAERVRYLSSYDVEERFFLFLREQFGERATIRPDISKKDMASAIGTTPETFSRLIQRLKAEGTIEWRSRELQVRPDTWRRYVQPDV